MKKLKEFRLNARMTQEDLAKAVDVDRTTVSCWETGISKPRVDKLLQLSKVLNCNITDLLCVK